MPPRRKKKPAPRIEKKLPFSKKMKGFLTSPITQWFAKVGFTLCCLIGFYGIYLDGKIRATMDGQVWQLPAEVYGQIPQISLKDRLSQQQVLELLTENGYQETTMIANPADFKWQGQELLMLRRAFPFPHQNEPQRLLRIHFDDKKRLDGIEDLTNNQRVKGFYFAPKLIAMMQSNNENRLALPLNQFPRLLIDSLLLTEDRNFFDHDGISFLSIGRALVSNLMAGRKVQGGSTITQQLVKNLFLSNERSYIRKFNEALMALLLDYRYSKNRILETYLNEVYLGQVGDTEIHGFALASLYYFNRPINEITLDQMALLVGMVKGPSLYNPWRHPEKARERRHVVLSLLKNNQMLDENLYAVLENRPLGIQPHGQITQTYPAFMQALRRELHQRLGAKVSHLSGTRIFTTLNLQQQKAAEQSILTTLPKLKKKPQTPLEVAIVVADYRTGGIRAMVGGSNPQYAGFNRVLDAQRQIGSLVKPSVYLTALSAPEHFALNTKLNNQPIRLKQPNGQAWSPRNYDRKYSEPVTLINALTRSLNIPTVNLGLNVGLDNIIKTQQAMGWDNVNIPRYPSMLLGAYSISPYEVTKLYQTLANNGASVPLSTFNAITDLNGNVLYQDNRQASQVVAPQASYLTLFAMQNVVSNGTARRLQKDFASLHLAGKTGTTNQSRDAWFVGIDGKNVATVWIGLDNNGQTGLTGASGAVTLYHNYLMKAKPSPLRLKVPENIHWAGIDHQGDWQCDLPYKIPFWQSSITPNCNMSFKEKAKSLWNFFTGN